MKKFFIIPFLVLALGFSAHADTPNIKNSFYYLFHLYYDAGNLYADRDFKYSYDVIPGEFTDEILTTQFPWRGEVVNVAGEVGAHFTFDPKQGDIKFVKGKISVRAPYVADAQKVVFYDAQNHPVLTIDVAASSYCNDDGICNEDRGEDSLTCPKDCKQTLPAPPVASTTPTPTASSGNLVSGILYTLAGIVLLGGLWWVFRRRKPPQAPPGNFVPPSSLPTPPPPPAPGNKL